MRILLIRLSSFGDIVLATPTIAALAKRYPHAHIDFVTYDRFRAALEHHPGVDRLLTLPKRRIRGAFKSWKLLGAAGGIRRFVRELRREQYDLVVDLHNVTDSALVGLLARGAHKAGARRQVLTTPFHTRTEFDDRNETATHHAAVTNLWYLVEAGWLQEHDVPAAPALEFHTPPAAKRNVDHFLMDNGLAGRALAGFNPGGSYAYKRWPAERFAEVANSVHERYGMPLLLFGGPAERDVVSEVSARITAAPVINTCDLSLYEAFELISRLRLFVTNDSAPLHVAAAAGTPTVGLYGPANYRKFAPLAPTVTPVMVDVPCRPCTPSVGRACDHRSCFANITVARVQEACAALLEAEHRRAS